jgi:hypothetical protein
VRYVYLVCAVDGAEGAGDRMTRIIALLLVLPACTPSSQRDAALAAVIAGATASVACGIANGQTEHQFELGACMIVGGTVAIGGGVVLHSQLEAGDRQETNQ